MQHTRLQTFFKNKLRFLTNHMPHQIPYTKVTLILYQTLSKKDTTWKINVNNLLFVYCRACCYYFLTNVTQPEQCNGNLALCSFIALKRVIKFFVVFIH